MFEWAIVEHDGSVVDRYNSREEAVRELPSYPNSLRLNVEWVPHPEIGD